MPSVSLTILAAMTSDITKDPIPMRDLILTKALLAVRNGTAKRAPLHSSDAYHFHCRVFRAMN